MSFSRSFWTFVPARVFVNAPRPSVIHSRLAPFFF
jgi:hypothetical protein